jgi:hypothetical protein
MKHLSTVVILLLACSSFAYSADKDAFSNRYKDKYLVLLKDGLAVGACQDREAVAGLHDADLPTVLIKMEGGAVAEIHPDIHVGFLAAGMADCGPINTEPLRRGETVHVTFAAVRRGDYWVGLQSNPHQMERGIGAFAHQTAEVGRATLRIKAASPEDAEKALDAWATVFDSQEAAAAAAKVGNTASGVAVKQISLGMAVGEVEEVLGPPATRVDLGPKMLYKYKDMTVEFKDGKVSDVR